MHQRRASKVTARRGRRSAARGRRCRALLGVLAALVLIGAPSGAAVAAPPPADVPGPAGPLGYRATPLVSVTGHVFYPSGGGNPISPTDRIAGIVLPPDGNYAGRQAAVFYLANRSIRVLHPPGSYASSGADINRRGQVTGTARFRGAPDQAYLWTPSTNTYQLLGSLGGNEVTPVALNDSGVVVGYATTAQQRAHAFVADPAVNGGRLRDLGLLPGDRMSAATGVNNSGEVVGYSKGGWDERRAFVWQPTKPVLTELPHPQWDNDTWATDINDQGYIVGGSGFSAPGSIIQKFSNGIVYTPVTHQFRVLPVPPGASSFATAISYHGTIVGYGRDSSYVGYALLWNGCGTSLQVLGETQYGGGAWGINRHEHIVGSGEPGGVLWRRAEGACPAQEALVAR